MAASSRWTPSSLTYVPPNDPSPFLQATFAFVDARNRWFGEDRDIEGMMNLFDDALEHRILPKSLGRPVLNKKQYAGYVSGLLELIKSYKMTLHEVLESTDNSIVFHATSVGEGQSGTPFIDEYMITLRFVPPNREGELPKICFVKEFVDSQVTAAFFREERRKASLRQQQ